MPETVTTKSREEAVKIVATALRAWAQRLEDKEEISLFFCALVKSEPNQTAIQFPFAEETVPMAHFSLMQMVNEAKDKVSQAMMLLEIAQQSMWLHKELKGKQNDDRA